MDDSGDEIFGGRGDVICDESLEAVINEVGLVSALSGVIDGANDGGVHAGGVAAGGHDG